MSSPSFGSLARHLRDRGVAPRYTARLCRELREHYEDIETECLRARASALGATVEARLRLGDEPTIAAEFARHPELNFWVYRSRLLFHALRVLSLFVVIAHIVAAAAYRLRAGLARFAFAAAAGIAMMGTLLLTLQITMSPEDRVPRGQRIAAVGTAATGDSSAEPAATETVAATETIAATADVVPSRTLALGEAAPRTKPERFDEPIAPPALLAVTFSDEFELPVGIGIPTELEINLTAFELGQGDQLRLADGDYLPIVKAVPAFPARAASRGLEGYVVLEYTVTPNGTVEDVVVVESSSDVFEASAVAAAYRFKYKPRIVAGRPVHARGVRTKVSYKIEA